MRAICGTGVLTCDANKIAARIRVDWCSALVDIRFKRTAS